MRLFNRIMVLGIVGSKELYNTAGYPYLRLSVGVTYNTVNDQNQYERVIQWFTVFVRSNPEYWYEQLSKGDIIYLMGELRVSKAFRDAGVVKNYMILGKEINLVRKKQEAVDDLSAVPQSTPIANAPRPQQRPQQPYGGQQAHSRPQAQPRPTQQPKYPHRTPQPTPTPTPQPTPTPTPQPTPTPTPQPHTHYAASVEANQTVGFYRQDPQEEYYNEEQYEDGVDVEDFLINDEFEIDSTEFDIDE